MGQYYLGYVNRNGKRKVFDNYVEEDWQGLKLMEHSWWLNSMVGNVVNDLFYNKGKVCWVGDYYAEDDYAQINCGEELVKEIGEYVWGDGDNEKPIRTKCTRKKIRYLYNCLLVNHTKKKILVCDDYYQNNKFIVKWEDKDVSYCIHPLPLLTCSASHSGGSYYGENQNQCGCWFNDEIEVVLVWELDSLLKKGYTKVMFEFKENQ